MDITRRGFLKGASATALLAGTHVLSWGAGTARASVLGDRILVLVYLGGGNDGLNTVVPLDDVGVAQRTLYESLRPDLSVPINLLSGMEIDPDPVLGTGLALHPNCTGLKTLYDEGKLAIVNGVGFEQSEMSHFVAEAIWFGGDPQGFPGSGWAGRQMDQAWGQPGIRGASFGDLNPALLADASSSLGLKALDKFRIPGGDRSLRKDTWQQVFADASRPASGMTARIAGSGGNLVSMSTLLESIETAGWGSHNAGSTTRLGSNLTDIASMLRYDALFPGSTSGVHVYHAVQGGFDTHSRQGLVDPGGIHPDLLDGVSRDVTNFQRDLEQLGIADRVLTVLYSEFGRRPGQNGSGANAGTDHGRAGVTMLLGENVAGGLYGTIPRLDDLDATGNLKVNVDFRRVYAAIIDDWLGDDHTAVLPGAPFAPLPVIL